VCWRSIGAASPLTRRSAPIEKPLSRCTRLRRFGEREIDGLLNFGYACAPRTKKGPTKNAGVPLTASVPAVVVGVDDALVRR